MTVPVNFDRGAVRSGIRQIGNVIIFHLWSSFMVIIFHLWSSFMESHSCGFAIIRSGSSIIRGAFNIIRDAFIQFYFHILSMDMISRLLKFGMWLTILFGFCLWSGMTMTCFNKVYLCTL